MRSLTPIATAMLLSAAPIAAAWSAEPAPQNGIPAIPVQQYLSTSHQPGEPVAVVGFPLCSDVDECRLLAGREYVSPRILFDASKLADVDKERLLHCLDPERGAKPCIAVLYGRAIPGRSVAPTRIEWQAYD